MAARFRDLERLEKGLKRGIVTIDDISEVEAYDGRGRRLVYELAVLRGRRRVVNEQPKVAYVGLVRLKALRSRPADWSVVGQYATIFDVAAPGYRGLVYALRSVAARRGALIIEDEWQRVHRALRGKVIWHLFVACEEANTF